MRNSLRKFLIQREAASEQTLSIFHQNSEQTTQEKGSATVLISACLRNVV